MSDFQATAVVAALFVLRCIVPIAIVMVVGYFMNKLVDRWRAADEQMMAERALEKEQTTVEPSSKPSLPVITIPCWILRNCEPEAKAECPAYRQPGLPCWMVKLTHEGQMPAACADCPIYEDGLALVPI